jgi:hypothetical protein
MHPAVIALELVSLQSFIKKWIHVHPAVIAIELVFLLHLDFDLVMNFTAFFYNCPCGL